MFVIKRFQPFKHQPNKMVQHTQTIRREQLTNFFENV